MRPTDDPMPLHRRAITLERAQVDRTARTVPATLSTEAPVARLGIVEVLSHAPDAVDLTRAAGGLPLLFAHDQAAPVGIVEQVRLDGRRLAGTLRFGPSAKADELLDQVEAGTLRHLSIGYRVDKWETAADVMTATRWTPYEASIVTVPADPAALIGRSAATRTTSMTIPRPAPGDAGALDSIAATRAAEVAELCTRHRVPELAADLIRSGADALQARAAIIDELARRDFASGGHVNVRSADAMLREGERGYSMLRGTAGPSEDVREQMVAALSARMGGPALTSENEYRHAAVPDLARELLERSGVRTTGMSRHQLIERASLHTTSDFPALLQDAGDRTLRQAYSAYQGGLRRIARQSTARDFRAKSRIMLGEAPALARVNEHGEFTYGGVAESRASYRLATFGRIVGLSRQALVNDDLDAFADLTNRMGRAAAEFESKFLVDLLLSNPAMDDGTAVFHANRNNLLTGASSALSLTSLTTARTAMRLQKGLDGVTPIDASPRFLIVPAALEATALQLTSPAYQPATTAAINPFAGQLEVVVDPRLDAVSSTAWYLAADPGVIDTIEYAYLEGEEGPRVTTRDGFTVDGLEFKVRLDFGAGILDFRGLLRSVGA